MMTRMLWMNYLKVIYDQLKKVIVPPIDKRSHSSFLSINTFEMNTDMINAQGS